MLTLVIGNQKYSSWSLRPWLLFKMVGIPFKEVKVMLRRGDTQAKIKKYSPAGRVPCLVDGKTKVWDSLSIAEYAAELYPAKELWPKDKAMRAHARSVCAEMHSSFMDMRTKMNMNCLGHFPGKGMTPEVRNDIDRICELWNDCRGKYGKKGPFLFGKFTIVDAFYAPVVFRFNTYEPAVDAVSKAYMKTILALKPMKEWLAAARQETETIPSYEPYR
jgi:glutathione S-transferase